MWDDISLWFSFVFSWWLVILNTFSYTYWLFVNLLWEDLYSGTLPILNWIIIIIASGLYEFFISPKCLFGQINKMWYTYKERKKESVVQSCPTLCNPTDCSPPGSSVHGIFQARVLQWVTISSSRGSSRPRDWTQVSHIAGRRFTVWATREYNGILFCNKREWGTNTCYNMDKAWKHYAKWKKPDTKDAILYDFIYMTCSEETTLLRQKTD